MRLLRINGKTLDIDESTAIGITFQAYDFTDPSKLKFSFSNNFTVPKTAKNLNILGYPGNPQSTSQAIYDFLPCDYWSDNIQFIKNGRCYVTEVGDRINLSITEKESVWDLMELCSWPSFVSEYTTWLNLPSASAPFIGSFSDFIAPYVSSTSGILLPAYVGNLAKYSPDEITFIENSSNIYVKYNSFAGGHFAAYCKSLFQFIESKFDVDFSASSVGLSYNLFDDPIASTMFIPLQNLNVQSTGTGFYFYFDNISTFAPEDLTEAQSDKTVLSFVKSFLQIFNALIDKKNDGYICRRFDDIINAPIVDFSGNMTGMPIFKPIIQNFKQNNYIKFGTKYEGAPDLSGSKYIYCNNKNIEAGTTDESLFDIDAYIPGGFAIGGGVILDMSVPEAQNQFTFMVASGIFSCTVHLVQDSVDLTTSKLLPLAVVYSLAGEYNTIQNMVMYPCLFEIKKYLRMTDVFNLQFFAQYRIKELNGVFFLNQIKNYNPKKTTEPVKIELIKITQNT